MQHIDTWTDISKIKLNQYISPAACCSQKARDSCQSEESNPRFVSQSCRLVFAFLIGVAETFVITHSLEGEIVAIRAESVSLICLGSGHGLDRLQARFVFVNARQGIG